MTASAFDQLVISTSSSSPLTGDGDGGIAAFKRMLAENEEDRLSSISCEAPTRGESSPTVADINNALRVKAVKPNPHQSNTDRFCLLEPSDYEALRNENEQLSRTIDQLERQLQSRMQAFEEAIREATAYQQKAELRQSQLDTLRAEHQKLKDSAASVTVLVDRNTQLHEENKSNRVQIERLMQERLRLDDDLARKDNKNVQLEQDVLQFTQQLGPLQHQLGRMSTIEEQLGDKVSEIERLKSDLATLTTQKNMQSEELTAARAELQCAGTLIKHIAWREWRQRPRIPTLSPTRTFLCSRKTLPRPSHGSILLTKVAGCSIAMIPSLSDIQAIKSLPACGMLRT